MSPDTVKYETRAQTSIITLNRPKKLNAINGPMVSGLHRALDMAEADEDIRCIVLNGAGRAFSSGFDLSAGDDGAANDPGSLREELIGDFDITMRFWDSPKVTIAAVHTYCLGGAMEIATACDMTIAARGCRFGAPEVKFGSGIVSLILPWLIGVKQAKELLLTGDDRVPARRALDLGLINKVVPEGGHLDEALAVADTIAANDPVAVQLTKRAINRSCDIMGLRQALKEALELGIEVEASETPESKVFNEILKTRGTKAAIQWREARLKRD